MASASTLLASTVAVVSGLPIMWLAVGAFCLSVGALTLGTAGYRQVRRVVRQRRVAQELRRVHEAAYRERFGRSGRLA